MMLDAKGAASTAPALARLIAPMLTLGLRRPSASLYVTRPRRNAPE